MKKIFFVALTTLAIHAHEKISQSSNDSLNTIVLADITLKKACANDASDYVRLVSDINVSRYLFGSPITQEKIDEINKSRFKTKILVPLLFGLPEFATRMLFHAGPRWMIKNHEDQTIGSISLAGLPNEIKQFLTTKGVHSKNYDNLAILLKPSEWYNGYAKETIFACLSRVFTNARYKNIQGVAFCFNKDNTNALHRILDLKTNETKKPVVYQGEINLPKDFNPIAPEAFTAACFTISKDDFMSLVESYSSTNKD